MKFIIFACLIVAAAAGIVPSAPIAAYSSPITAYSAPITAYSDLSSPLQYSNFYNTPLAYSPYNAPLVRSSLGYSAVAPLAYSAGSLPYSAGALPYSAAPFYRNQYIRAYPYGF